MEHGHWTPPNRGKVNVVTSLDYGMGCGTHTAGASAVPVTNGTTVARGGGKSADPTAGGKGTRTNRLNTGERYGPTGVVQVARHYHGPGCPDCSGSRSVRTVPSAFGAQDNFRSGHGSGKA